MHLPLILGRSIVGVGIAGLGIVGASQLPTSNGQQVDRAVELPLVAPIVSSELTSDRGERNTTVELTAQQRPPTQLHSARIAFKEAKVAVALSQAQLVQARANLSEFQAKHDNTKILARQGKTSRQQLDTTRAAIELARSQHHAATIGLQAARSQLIAAKAEVSKLGCKANSTTEM
jgi:Outer membrane efflux protein